jgi:hypothetical protein
VSFRNRTIYTGFRSEEPGAAMYRRLLGPAYETLPPSIRQLHDSAALRRWSGRAEVRRGRGLLARLVAAVIGFPPAGSGVPVSVTFSPEGKGERWERNFGGRRFSSLQYCGTGRDQYLLVERFGIAAFGLALVVENERLFLIPRRWTLLGIPMPKSFIPGGASFETEEDGRFHFNVEIRVPLAGLVVAYRGMLEPETLF